MLSVSPSPLHTALLALLLCIAGVSRSAAQPVSARIDSAASVIDYTGSATMHDWTGTSRDVSGTLVIDRDTPDSSRALVRVPVASFDSGIGARDANMRDVTEADRYPTVSFRATEIRPTHWGRSSSGLAGRWEVTGALTFHGQTHPVDATVDVRVTDDSVHAHAQFPVSLTRFGVERPGIVWGVAPIADTIRIDARVAGAVQEPATATERLDTTRSDVTGTRRVASTDLRSLPASQYRGARAGFHTAVRRLVEGEREWIVSVYGFADAPTGLTDAQTVTLRADGRAVEPLRTIRTTRELDDATVEMIEMQVSRSGYEALATALTASVTVGASRFPLPWKARRDLRLILERAAKERRSPVSARDAN